MNLLPVLQLPSFRLGFVCVFFWKKKIITKHKGKKWNAIRLVDRNGTLDGLHHVLFFKNR